MSVPHRDGKQLDRAGGTSCGPGHASKETEFPLRIMDLGHHLGALRAAAVLQEAEL
ncbi:hypothetical protein CBM2634_A110019 [Cupriavidus taiwanensis]|uniref:Uncharacterized protein n=1 Tax=Cupriavidus taiwanensis TaxID=164546 RepID=A0A375IW87_9BURK|nr:hypothetical protein CBM2634_A110019 [Cupriavidus taiwanensis]